MVYDNEVFLIGEWFGGYGVTNIKLADIDNDGEMELYFTFSWGSGVHRSQVGYFNPKTKEIVVFNYSNMFEDMALVLNDKGDLLLYEATISKRESFVDLTMETGDHIADIVFENNNILLMF